MIDLSNLSQEKRVFLKAHPELLKSLETAIPKQLQRTQKRKEKIRRGKAKWQRELEDVEHKIEKATRRADELRREYIMDPNLRKIQAGLMGKLEIVRGSKELVCPGCLEGDKGNKVNGKPWCLKCDSPLVPFGKVKKWLKLPKVKRARRDLKDEFKKRGLDF